MFRKLACATTVSFLMFGASAQGAEFRLMLESNTNETGGEEIFLASFATIDDLLTSTISSSSFSSLNINSEFRVGGLAYDGAYRLLLESNANETGGEEIFLANFATFDDLLTSTISSSSFSSLNINSEFRVGGLVYDGMYRLLLESNANETGGEEIFIASFATIDDLLTSTLSSSSFSSLNINSEFSVGGLAYDGMYRLLLESNTNETGGEEVFLASFATFDDLLLGTIASSSFSSLNINSDFGIRGFAYEFDPATPEVPLPAAAYLFLAGIAGLNGVRRKRR